MSDEENEVENPPHNASAADLYINYITTAKPTPRIQPAEIGNLNHIRPPAPSELKIVLHHIRCISEAIHNLECSLDRLDKQQVNILNKLHTLEIEHLAITDNFKKIKGDLSCLLSRV